MMLKTELHGRCVIVDHDADSVSGLVEAMVMTILGVASQAGLSFGDGAPEEFRRVLSEVLADPAIWAKAIGKAERIYEVDSPEDFWADDWPLKND